MGQDEMVEAIARSAPAEETLPMEETLLQNASKQLGKNPASKQLERKKKNYEFYVNLLLIKD